LMAHRRRSGQRRGLLGLKVEPMAPVDEQGMRATRIA